MNAVRKLITNYKKELIIAAIALGALFVAAPVITQAKYVDDIQSKQTIINKNSKGVVLLDRNGKSFFTFYDGKSKQYVPLSSISKPVQQAVIVAEDENFYKHNGVSINAIFGAMLANFKKGDIAYGGSTITQQLVKNTLLDSKRNLYRKYEEFVLAQEIEDKYTKEEILEMYLNSVYFGEGAYGIEEAAQTYFGKRASDLDVSEASMLAGVIAAPSTLSPISGDQAKAKARQAIILDEMVEDAYISDAERQAAKQKAITYINASPKENVLAPHFALLVQQQLLKQYGEKYLATSGLKVRTTLDLSSQAVTEEAVRTQIQRLLNNNGSNASVVVINPKTGEVLSLVGSANWYNEQYGKVNMAVTPRQPGSAFKPIVYLAGFERQTITPASILLDVPRKFENNYKPKNYDEKFRGPVTTRYALANSLNVPSVEIMTQLGTDTALTMSKRLGITTLKTASDYGPSLVLGSGEVSLLELTNAYATFANQGERRDPVLISSIEDKQGKVIYRNKAIAQKVVDPKYTFLISSILSDTKTRRDVFGGELDISRPAAVKTGTTEFYKDAWTVGYTPSLAVGVWVGNNDNTAMNRVAGSLGAAPIWKNVMEQLLAGTPVETFRQPTGVIASSVCGTNPRVSFRGNSIDTEYFVLGTQGKACQPLDGTRFAFDEELRRALTSLNDDKDDDNKDNENTEWERFGTARGGPSDQSQPTSTPAPTQNQPTQGTLQQQTENIEQLWREQSNRDEERDNNGNGRGRGRGGND